MWSTWCWMGRTGAYTSECTPQSTYPALPLAPWSTCMEVAGRWATEMLEQGRPIHRDATWCWVFKHAKYRSQLLGTQLQIPAPYAIVASYNICASKLKCKLESIAGRPIGSQGGPSPDASNLDHCNTARPIQLSFCPACNLQAPTGTLRAGTCEQVQGCYPALL